MAWVGPQIPPLLAELGNLLLQVGGWLIGTALPTLISNLAKWGAEFVAWVGPQIPPLLIELGKLEAKIISWILTDAIPAIVEKIAQLAAKFVTWVATDVLPKLPGALGDIISTIGGWITDTALPWAGSALYGAGKAIIQGLIDGIGAMFGALKSKLGEVTNLIPDWKGPLEKDRMLLFGAGQAIMQGLMNGLTSQQGALAGVLGLVSNQISNAFSRQANIVDAWMKSQYADPSNPTAAEIAAAQAELNNPFLNGNDVPSWS